MRILVVRNDKLGDFMLAWPAFAMIKHSVPDARVAALVPAYTEPLARLCPWIDEVVIDPGHAAGHKALRQAIESFQADALLTLFSTTRVALAGLTAGISYRLAPATKFAQLFYNHRLVQRRSNSDKPEWAYNVDLANRMIIDFGASPAPLPVAPYLRFPAEDTATRRQTLLATHQLPTDATLLFIHPGSGGSASSLSTEQFANLAAHLVTQRTVVFVIGSGPGEEPKAEALGNSLVNQSHVIIKATSIADYARYIACADLFISGSTGPLHIAGALDVPTAAFYTRRRSATPLRWQTLNSPERRLAFTPPDDADEMDMSRIDIAAAAAEISRRFLQ